MDKRQKSLSGGVIAVILLVISVVVFVGRPIAAFGDPLRQGNSAEPIWTFDSDLDVKHTATADLNGDGIPDVIAGEYSNSAYGALSRVSTIDGVSGDTIWTYQLNDGVRSMAIGDLNDDGIADVVAGAAYNAGDTPDGRVHAIDGSDGSPLWTYFVGSSINCLTVGDFNGDQYLDVAAGSLDGIIYAINGDTGGQLWLKDIGSLWINGLAAADVDDDNIEDIAFAHEYLTNFDNFCGVLNGTDGDYIWLDTVVYAVMDVLLEDIDDDGHPETVFGGIYRDDTGKVFVRTAADGAAEWDFGLGSLDHTNGDIVLGAFDLDEDIDLDLVVGTYLGTHIVYAFDGDVASPVWQSDVLTGNIRDFAFGDVTGEKDIDVIAAMSDRVEALNGQDGSEIYYYAVDGTIQDVAVGDFDEDAVLDVAAGGGAGHSGNDPAIGVWALKTILSPVLWEYDYEEYGNGLAVDDINGDGFDDVAVVCSVEDKVVTVNGGTGLELWTWKGSANLYAVATGDLDNNGVADVAVAGYDETVTAIAGSTGDLMWQFTDPTSQIYRKCLQTADVNADGAADVIAGCDNGQVYAIDGPTGTEIWSCPIGGPANEVQLAQMNEKGPIDVVAAVGSGGEKVIVIDGSDGSVLWEYMAPESVEHIEVFDANDDGHLDIAAGVTPWARQIIMIDGLSHDSIWTKAVDIPSNTNGMAHGDLDYDKIPEVIVPGNSSDKKVYALRGTDGFEHWSFVTGGEVNCLMVADVDNDLDIEVVAGGDDQKVYVITGYNGQEEWSYSTVDEVMDLGLGDISGNGLPNIACITFGSNGLAYAFRSLASGPAFVCGDLNDDEVINILDVTFLISYLYMGGPAPDPLESADVNSDGVVNILDVTYLISYLYMGGPEPDCP